MHTYRRADAALDCGRPHDVGGGVYAVEHLGGLYAHDEGESEEFCDGVYGCFAGVFSVFFGVVVWWLTWDRQQWFFWTWKIGPSAVDNSPRSPLWSYKLGIDNGWIPLDPREAVVRAPPLCLVTYPRPITHSATDRATAPRWASPRAPRLTGRTSRTRRGALVPLG